ncbi:Sec-independent protein translocase protein TatB [Corynebacterium ciconiae]|uniref:Sec-independent protein translocase protein TatB n=1 Tax=Corynebacterium ciconiae TaxID=227319 RepID=UPI00038049D9|nr:Sec-independent protein translocase protein TatB [Corynebacterium ciconiae]
MFSSIGWGEIFVVCVVVLIVVGPDRLPRVIQDIRAAIIAARDAINRTKQTLNEEIGPEFEEVARPVQEFTKFTAMGPKAALTKALFDGDGSYLDAFDPKKIMASDTQGEAYREQGSATPSSGSTVVPNTHSPSTGGSAQQPQQPQQMPPSGPQNRNFSWDDIT